MRVFSAVLPLLTTESSPDVVVVEETKVRVRKGGNAVSAAPITVLDARMDTD